MTELIEGEAYASVRQYAEAHGVRNLATVLRTGLSYASLYLTSQQQIDDLAGNVAPLNVKGEMASDWRFISLQFHHPQRQMTEIYLVGERGQNQIVTMTSPVQTIDFENGLVRTRNSVYRIRKTARGRGEPPATHLISICRTLRSWGMGQLFDIPAL